MTNYEIIHKGQQYVMNTYGRFPTGSGWGKGSYLWDADGKKYLDFVGGIAVCALGHSPEVLNKALREQARQLWHISNLYWIKPQVELAEKLVKVSGLDQVSSVTAELKPMKPPSSWPASIFTVKRKPISMR